MKSFFIYFMMSWVLVFAVVVEAYSGELIHTFKSPSFSGQGYSAHVMTIENQEFSRNKAIEDKKAADVRQAIRDEANTNLAKFMKNVESRI